MSLQRKIERNQLKKQWKEHNEEVPKKQKTEFKEFWKWYQNTKKTYKTN